MADIQNEIERFGSADFASERETEGAGLFKKTPNALFIGFFGNRPMYWNDPGGLLLTAGARGGKLKDILAFNICYGTYTFSMLILDMKGELAAISQNQTPDKKYCIYWNPAALHGLPMHRINPVDYIRIDSPTLVSDVKVFCENMIPLSGSANGQYFERRAREFLEAIILTIVRLEGVLTLPALYRAINLIPGGGDEWLNFAFEMSEAGFEISARIEEEIANSRGQQGTGFQGILGEVFKAFSALSDPVLLKSVSPPYDASLADLCSSDRAYHLYIMPPAEFIDPWSSVIKAIFVAGMVYKSRAPQAPRQTWVLDECAQLNAFPLVPKLFTYGAGIGIRPWAVFQSTFQMSSLGPNAENIITSSAALRSYFAIREIQSATAVSRMLGAQTLEYDDDLQQARSRLAKQEALQSLLNGEDPLSTGLRLGHHHMAAKHRTKQHRLLRTPDEVLNTKPGKQYIFADGLQKPIFANRKAYFDVRFMAGRYHGNPYHPPLEKVRVKTRFGHSWRRVVQEPVPHAFSSYPQYADGMWSYVSSD